MITDFRIYYAHTPIYQGEPENAPTQGVQAIAWNDPERGTEDLGRVVLFDWDIYIYSDHIGSWHGTNKYIDLMYHLGLGCGPGGVRAVLQGAWINHADFLKIKKHAETDPGLRRKSAQDPVREDGTE